MKIISIATLIVISCLSVDAQDLQTVLNKNSAALGLDARKTLTNLHSSGHFIMNGTETKIPFTLIQAKPDKLRIETTVFGFRAIQTYDGTNAWSLSFTQGIEAVKTDPRNMEFIAAATAIDGPFSVNKNNKYLLKYIGSDTYQEKPVEIIMWSSREERLIYYINSENWLVDGVRYEYHKNGGWYSMEYRIKSYRDFLGTMFPKEVSALKNGVEMVSLFVTHQEIPDSPDGSKFGKPSFTM
ncbi:MAG: hypothetical protein WD052_05155 [Bacteroidales bacterium]